MYYVSIYVSLLVVELFACRGQMEDCASEQIIDLSK